MAVTNTLRSVTVGSFDGIHIAHQALIARAEAVAAIERWSGYLTPGYKRAEYLGAKPLFIYDFERIRMLDAEAFVALLTTHFPRLERIVVGYDFRFGKDKQGTPETLRRWFHGEVDVVEEVTYEGVSVHSRVIKRYIEEGDVAFAAKLLGRPYKLEGRVIRGQGLGAKALVPTLNLAVEGYVLPKEGVYATRTMIEGKAYPSVSFVGHRVTTDGRFAVETHVLDRRIEVSRGYVGLAFLARIRPNRAFDSLDALKEQIFADMGVARAAAVCEKG